MLSPTACPAGAACSAPSTEASAVPRRPSRQAGERSPKASPARTHATGRYPGASRSSDAWPPAEPSTGRPSRGTPACRRAWRRCGAVRERLSRVTPQCAGDLPHTLAHRPEDRDLLALLEREVPARGLGQRDRRHAASVTKPPRTHRPRHADRQRRLHRRDPRGDQAPELALHDPRRIRPPRRTHRRPQRTVSTPLPTPPLRNIAGVQTPVRCSHAAYLRDQGVATTS